MFQEFPKMLYREDAHCIVGDAEQDKAARADGWHDFGDEAAEPKPDAPRRGRPPKAKAD